MSLAPARVSVLPHGEYGFFERLGEVPERRTARRALELESEAEVALFFGYIREYKGLDVLFDAWEAVKAARPNARLVVAGDPVRLDPNRRRELESWATRLGVIHRFSYIPFSEVTGYFAAADVLVLPYRHISQSGVLFLGLSLGLPIVATTVGAVPEVLTDESNALLVPPERPDLLAEALVRVLRDSALRARLAEGGRRVAETHSWSSIAKNTESLYVQQVKSQR